MSGEETEKSEWITNILRGSEINLTDKTQLQHERIFFAKGTRDTRNCTM